MSIRNVCSLGERDELPLALVLDELVLRELVANELVSEAM